MHYGNANIQYAIWGLNVFTQHHALKLHSDCHQEFPSLFLDSLLNYMNLPLFNHSPTNGLLWIFLFFVFLFLQNWPTVKNVAVNIQIQVFMKHKFSFLWSKCPGSYGNGMIIYFCFLKETAILFFRVAGQYYIPTNLCDQFLYTFSLFSHSDRSVVIFHCVLIVYSF